MHNFDRLQVGVRQYGISKFDTINNYSRYIIGVKIIDVVISKIKLAEVTSSKSVHYLWISIEVFEFANTSFEYYEDKLIF